MLELKYRTPDIEKASKAEGKILLVANLGKTHQLFQGQSLSVLTGVAIKSDQHVFAMAMPELNKIGLVLGSGVELLHSDGQSEIEVIVWNRNSPGQQRMIEILPGMPIAELMVMPKYCQGLTDPVDPGQEKVNKPTLASLRKECDDKEIKYKAKDTIKELTELLNGQTG